MSYGEIVIHFKGGGHIRYPFNPDAGNFVWWNGLGQPIDGIEVGAHLGVGPVSEQDAKTDKSEFPTGKLRFVERFSHYEQADPTTQGTQAAVPVWQKILQQEWHCPSPDGEGGVKLEWRDVPMPNESWLVPRESKPTGKLRFVQRFIGERIPGVLHDPKQVVTVLQQEWHCLDLSRGKPEWNEWRDVPYETEETPEAYGEV